MEVARGAAAMTTGQRTTRVLLFAVFFVAAIALLVWRYNASAKQSTSQAGVTHTAQPLVKTAVAPAANTQSLVQISAAQTATPPAPTKTTVQVNGQSVPVPTSGTIHKVIQNASGTTSVDISVSSNSSGNTDSTSSTNIDLDSSSNTTTSQ